MRLSRCPQVTRPEVSGGAGTQTQVSLAPTRPPHRLQGQLMLVSLSPLPSVLSPPSLRALLPDPSGMDPGFLHSQEEADAPDQGLDLPRFQPQPAGVCAKRKLCICRERWRRGSPLLGSLLVCTEPPLPVYTFNCECVQRAVPSSATSSG